MLVLSSDGWVWEQFFRIIVCVVKSSLSVGCCWQPLAPLFLTELRFYSGLQPAWASAKRWIPVDFTWLSGPIPSAGDWFGYGPMTQLWLLDLGEVHWRVSGKASLLPVEMCSIIPTAFADCQMWPWGLRVWPQSYDPWGKPSQGWDKPSRWLRAKRWNDPNFLMMSLICWINWSWSCCS